MTSKNISPDHVVKEISNYLKKPKYTMDDMKILLKSNNIYFKSKSSKFDLETITYDFIIKSKSSNNGASSSKSTDAIISPTNAGARPTGSTITTKDDPAQITIYKKKYIKVDVKNEVWINYNGREWYGTCFCCSVVIEIIDWHCGHIEAEACGGETTVDNMRPVCKKCNLSMRTTNMYEYMRKKYPDSQNIPIDNLTEKLAKVNLK